MVELDDNNLNPQKDPLKDTNNHHSKLLASTLFFGFASGFIGALVAMSIPNLNNPFMTQQKPLTEMIIKEGQVIADIAADISPSVVSIKVESPSIFENIFSETVVQQSAGTGLILTKDGVVVTNRHVIPTSGSKIDIVTSDGKAYDDVQVIDRDEVNDIAFLKINSSDKFKPAPLGDSNRVRVGERVVAIGNALGQFSNSVTSGIISGTGRPIVATSNEGSESLSNLLQTDASINPGNSGGPLVNIQGQVIGINTAIADKAENIGFSIPINDIKPLFASMIVKGRIVRPYLGVRFVPVTLELTKEFGLKEDKGVLVIASDGTAVLPGSPADKANIRSGDIITRIDKQDISKNSTLTTLINEHKVGDKITISINRDGQSLRLTAVLEEAPF